MSASPAILLSRQVTQATPEAASKVATHAPIRSAP